ncbi:HPP family protein [Magnetococcales bacterium HHB-1]
MNAFFAKMRGQDKSPPASNLTEVFWSWFGAFSGIALLAYLHQYRLQPQDMVMIIGSFGASAVLIYGAITSPLAQPRNLIGGHLLSAIVGVTIFQMIPIPWLASALAVSLAIAVMQMTKTLHPPGGATALIAVIGSDTIHQLGYLYVLIPVGSGALLMLIVALIVNNLAPTRRYPLFWW